MHVAGHRDREPGVVGELRGMRTEGQPLARREILELPAVMIAPSSCARIARWPGSIAGWPRPDLERRSQAPTAPRRQAMQLPARYASPCL